MTILSNNNKKKDKEKEQKDSRSQVVVANNRSNRSPSLTTQTSIIATSSSTSTSTSSLSLSLTPSINTSNTSVLTTNTLTRLASNQNSIELDTIQEKNHHIDLNATNDVQPCSSTNKRKNRAMSPSSYSGIRRPKTSKNTNPSATSSSSSSDESNSPLNSEDEYDNRNLNNGIEYNEELELAFCKNLKDKRGFIIKPMKEDGACLFRAVADHIYGDEEMHSLVRNHCMDYIAKNSDYFRQYITEDLDRYLRRKRRENCHGNHIEMIAIAEMYNRPIEVYEYTTEPKNTFQSVYQTDNDPIRLSYHGRNHYNSVVDPYKATIGVGLGLPSFVPGLAEKNLMNDALQKSEEFHIEKAMLDDKLKATDWEATNDEIMEMVARESYIQWLKDNEKRQNSPRNTTATCSTWHKNSPKASTRSSHLVTNNESSTSTQDLSNKDTLASTSKSNKNSPKSLNTSPKVNNDFYANPELINVDDWEYTGNDILLQVLAQSQQEYLDSLKSNTNSQQQASNLNDTNSNDNKKDDNNVNNTF